MLSRGRWKVIALFVVLLLGFALGIWGSYRAVYPEKGVHRVAAVFQARADDTTILIQHEAAPALAMGSMELMSFDVESKALLDQAGLKPGDRVRLTIRQIPHGLIVVKIDRIQ
ncbi:MAG: copper-binding protein [Candidatus Rokubacteria bacterium]|nr:copper-binding protein [Candidatus Rokubacteria bacterium]